jgi:hypothetical protein
MECRYIEKDVQENNDIKHKMYDKKMQRLTFLLHILDVQGSNIGLRTAYPDGRSSKFWLSPSRKNFVIVFIRHPVVLLDSLI